MIRADICNLEKPQFTANTRLAAFDKKLTLITMFTVALSFLDALQTRCSSLCNESMRYEDAAPSQAGKLCILARQSLFLH